MKKIPQPYYDLVIAAVGAVALGAIIGAFCPGSFWQSWLACGLFSFIALFLMIIVWRRLGASNTLAILILVTFFLRIAVGIFIYQALPIIGYDSTVQKAGFFYSDAHTRDQAAYQIATGEGPLLQAFSNPDYADQYGGLLFLTSATYRFLSPDVARPLLLTLLAAFAMAAGVAFLYSAIQQRWTQRVAVLAAWIFVLFPDSVLLGSSQMREPFLISLACISFWAVLQWQQKPLRAILVPVVSLAAACAFSLPAGFVIIAILTAVFLIDWSLSQNDARKQHLGIAILSVVGIAALFGGWLWLKNTLYFDAYTTKLGSGWITALIEQYGEEWNIPFVTIYGLTQPLLPAAIFEPSLPFWVTIAILRSLAWYAALPLLFFGVFASWRADKKEQKWLLVMLFTIFFLWVVVASARSGGDQWDNPRYRYILLPFMSLILGWAIEHYRLTRSPWLWCWVAVIGVFLLFFTNYYANRYITSVTTWIPFIQMIKYIILISGVILASGFLWDKLHSRKKAV